MALKGDLYSYLTGLTTITDEFSTRIYPSVAPTSATTYPYCTYERVSSQHESHTTGAAGLAMATFQFDIFDDDAVGADEAAEALRTVLDGYDDGAINGGGSTDVRRIDLVNERDGFLPPTNDSERGLFNISMDFDIWYVESVPSYPAS